MVNPYSSTDTDSLKESSFYCVEEINFYIIDNHPITIHTFTKRTSTLFSVGAIFLNRYENSFANSIALPVNWDMAAFCLKHMYSDLHSLRDHFHDKWCSLLFSLRLRVTHVDIEHI